MAYWAFSEYHGTFYDPFYSMLRRFWISLVSAAVAYTWFLDGLMVDPRDAYWQLGRAALGHPSDAAARTSRTFTAGGSSRRSSCR